MTPVEELIETSNEFIRREAIYSSNYRETLKKEEFDKAGELL